MVVLLIFNVSDCEADLTWSNTKCSITLLPGEAFVAGKLLMYKMRCNSFDLIHQPGNIKARWKLHT